jgi:hypothetical protein
MAGSILQCVGPEHITHITPDASNRSDRCAQRHKPLAVGVSGHRAQSAQDIVYPGGSFSFGFRLIISLATVKSFTEEMTNRDAC